MVRALRILCAVAAVVTLVIMVLVGEFSDAHQIGIFFVFAIVVNAPHILGWVFAPQFTNDKLALGLFGIVYTCTALFGLYMYWWTFFADRQKDAQDALIFVVFPIYQLGAVLAAYIIARVIVWVRR